MMVHLLTHQSSGKTQYFSPSEPCFRSSCIAGDATVIICCMLFWAAWYSPKRFLFNCWRWPLQHDQQRLQQATTDISALFRSSSIRRFLAATKDGVPSNDLPFLCFTFFSWLAVFERFGWIFVQHNLQNALSVLAGSFVTQTCWLSHSGKYLLLLS